MQPYRPMTPRAVYSPIPPTPGSPAYEKESHMGNDHAARQQREAADEVLREYEEKQSRWVFSTIVVYRIGGNVNVKWNMLRCQSRQGYRGVDSSFG